MAKPVLVGAVIYDPKVSVIWEIISDYFNTHGCPMDVVFYTNYELQVEALLKGHIEVAWNSPLAWLEAQHLSGGACRAIAMRDTDQDRVSYLVVRQNSGLNQLEDLRGKTVATGAKDSPQATLIPVGLLQRHGLEPDRDFQVKRFDVLVGKHGDHVGGERQAFDCLAGGEADVCAMLDFNWQSWTADGTINQNEFRILASTDKFDHCVFTVHKDFPQAVEEKWLQTLFSMSYDNPDHRQMMDLEGLKAWLPGRTSGFGPLTEAVAKQRFFEKAG